MIDKNNSKTNTFLYVYVSKQSSSVLGLRLHAYMSTEVDLFLNYYIIIIIILYICIHIHTKCIEPKGRLYFAALRFVLTHSSGRQYHNFTGFLIVAESISCQKVMMRFCLRAGYEN